MTTNLDVNVYDNVVSIHQHDRIFSLNEARSLLPIILKITKRWHEKSDKVLLAYHYCNDAQKREKLEEEFNDILNQWSESIERLGAVVKGPWLADFDTGDGHYWCWQYPETDIMYSHSHTGSFKTRQKIADRDS